MGGLRLGPIFRVVEENLLGAVMGGCARNLVHLGCKHPAVVANLNSLSQEAYSGETRKRLEQIV